MRRTFIGIKIEPDPKIHQLYHELKSNLKYPQLRWIDADNLHLTIRFLGNTEENQIETIIKRLDILIPQYTKFNLEIIGLGIFGSRNFPRILWAGIEMPSNIQSLINGIEDIVCDNGFARETKIYSPHLTICRIKNLKETAGLLQYLDKYREIFFKRQEVREINLYESILKSSGSVYQVIHTFLLSNYF